MPHRALVVDEVLREVAGYATTHPPTAVSLACSAKFIEEMALSTLWGQQYNLITLIKTLPPDSWAIVSSPDNNHDKIVRDSPQLDL